ncbi:hypothetical protein DFH09DRAFT_1373743 [Mycena vulgaris]|nr:hypothetical protein DFH09DRAFT_1373743 [Mycena vulgaris]
MASAVYGACAWWFIPCLSLLLSLTDPRHGMAWHRYEYAGRVRPWDGLIGLVMRPCDRTIELATYFISGPIVGRDTFERTWQMAAQDVLAPSWGGSMCLVRGEE